MIPYCLLISKGRIFEDSIRDGNFAVGFRQMTNTGFNAGIWLGYAPFRSSRGNVYHGIAGGLELLSHNFDFRLNGYLPFDDDRIISQSAQRTFLAATTALELGTDEFVTDGVVFTDLFVVTRTTDVTRTTTVREHAMAGFDGEVGARLPLEQLGFVDGKYRISSLCGWLLF